MEIYFGIYVIFGRWNQHKRGHTEHTTHQGAPGTPWHAQVSCALLEGRLGPFFWRKKDNLWKKSCKNFSAIGVTGLQKFKKP